MTANVQRAFVLSLLVLLMLGTRINHFAPIPDASWAAFFLGGFYLRGWSRWAFPVFMALAVAVDYVVITGQGMDFWAHYCMSAAYWFLVPAYFAMWLGGLVLRKYYQQANGKALAVLVASLFGSVVVCHLLSQGSFYWLSDSVVDPTFAGWWKNYSDWFLPYLTSTAIYVGLATIVHVGVLQGARLRAPASSTN